MNPDCTLYDPEKNFCAHFGKGNVPVAKICPSCQYRQPAETMIDPCLRFRTGDEIWCYNAAAGIFRHNAVDGVCTKCSWPEGSDRIIYDE